MRAALTDDGITITLDSPEEIKKAVKIFGPDFLDLHHFNSDEVQVYSHAGPTVGVTIKARK